MLKLLAAISDWVIGKYTTIAPIRNFLLHKLQLVCRHISNTNWQIGSSSYNSVEEGFNWTRNILRTHNREI